MWPWGHAAAAYLLYRVWIEVSDWELRETDALVIGFGAILPDLIDKPLAWTFGVLPNGRSLGHSVVTMGLVLVVAWVVIRDARRRRILAVGAGGVGVHMLTDGLPSALSGEFAQLAFLLWPVLPPVEYTTGQSFIAHFSAIDLLAPYFLLQNLLTVVALGVWYRDGLPGLSLLRP